MPPSWKRRKWEKRLKHRDGEAGSRGKSTCVFTCVVHLMTVQVESEGQVRVSLEQSAMVVRHHAKLLLASCQSTVAFHKHQLFSISVPYSDLISITVMHEVPQLAEFPIEYLTGLTGK